MRGACHLQKNCAIVALFAKKHIVCFNLIKLIETGKVSSCEKLGKPQAVIKKPRNFPKQIEKMKKS